MHTQRKTYTHICVHVCIHTHVHVYTYVYMYAYICVYVYVYMYIHTYTHACKERSCLNMFGDFGDLLRKHLQFFFLQGGNFCHSRQLVLEFLFWGAVWSGWFNLWWASLVTHLTGRSAVCEDVFSYQQQNSPCLRPSAAIPSFYLRPPWKREIESTFGALF